MTKLASSPSFRDRRPPVGPSRVLPSSTCAASGCRWARVTGGRDLSERNLQSPGPVPQYSLAKSFPGFAPIGPPLVTPDENPDPNAIELSCSVNDEIVQCGNTNDMVFSVLEIVARLSIVTPLLPGDVIFTGTPSGVSVGRIPQRFLKPGDELFGTSCNSCGPSRSFSESRRLYASQLHGRSPFRLRRDVIDQPGLSLPMRSGRRH